MKKSLKQNILKIVSVLLVMVFSLSVLVSCSGGGDADETEIKPYIKDGYWWIGNENTGVKAEGVDGDDGDDGKDGETPYIKDGYWWLGDKNTGVKVDDSVGSEGLEYYILPDDSYGVMVGTAKYLTNIVIPETHFGKPVTKILDDAFKALPALESITIPNTVVSIGSAAFYGCVKLKSVTIPSGVKSIEKEAFGGCAALKELVIPSSVESIGAEAFSGCTALEKLTVSDGVLTIGTEAFNGCDKLAQITLSDTLISIGEDAFSNTECFNTQTNWENEVLYIGNHLIKAQGTLTGSYTVKAGTKSIANNAFAGCSALSEILLPEGMVNIGNSAFRGCTSLLSVTAVDGLKTIGISAFADCTSLACVVLPKSLGNIKANAFNNCSALAMINYFGNTDEWNAVQKDTSWDSNTGAYTVYFNTRTVS